MDAKVESFLNKRNKIHKKMLYISPSGTNEWIVDKNQEMRPLRNDGGSRQMISKIRSTSPKWPVTSVLASKKRRDSWPRQTMSSRVLKGILISNP